jgi:hypothetical protein
MELLEGSQAYSPVRKQYGVWSNMCCATQKRTFHKSTDATRSEDGVSRRPP